MIKPGTLCLIVGRSGLWGVNLEGRVCSVIERPTELANDLGSLWGYLVHVPGAVGPNGSERWALSPHRLVPISDPDADVSEWTGGKYPSVVTA